jgi:EAL domain-containing protein (putative c-di-GMP-specific phosphodiesterase class I)
MFFSPKIDRKSEARMELERELREALEREELLLHYQPQVEVGSGRVVGVEGLLRWQHPTQGLLPAQRFISLAEEVGLVEPLGAWVLRTACQEAKGWIVPELADFSVGVNVSGGLLQDGALPRAISEALRETNLESRRLELEVTEADLMQRTSNAMSVLESLSAQGIRFCLDGFGAGFSSLSYLRRWPVGRVKIAGPIVRDIAPGSEGAEMVGAIIDMAHRLNLKVIAEGVETEEQLAFLRENGCDQYQGFLYSEPVPAQEISSLLRSEG